jgi:8-oxo-dGTP diphosphatase
MTMTGSVDRPIPGVGVVVIEDDSLLVVQRGRGANAGLWAVPGGKVDLGESMRAAAAREVREETGLEVEIGEVIWIGEAIGPGSPPAWHFVLVDFLGRVVGGDLGASDDAQRAEFVALDRVRELPLTPTMYDLLDVLDV